MRGGGRNGLIGVSGPACPAEACPALRVRSRRVVPGEEPWPVPRIEILGWLPLSLRDGWEVLSDRSDGGAGGSFPGCRAASVEEVFLVELDPVFAEECLELVVEGAACVVLFLRLDVPSDRGDLRLAH